MKEQLKPTIALLYNEIPPKEHVMLYFGLKKNVVGDKKNLGLEHDIYQYIEMRYAAIADPYFHTSHVMLA